MTSKIEELLIETARQQAEEHARREKAAIQLQQDKDRLIEESRTKVIEWL